MSILYPSLFPLPFNSLLILYPLPSAMQADLVYSHIRHIILSSGVVSTLAGQAGSNGATNGVATNARFNNPVGIALDAAGTFAVVVS